MGVFHLFFGFGGRINRAKYWFTLVIWILIWIIAVEKFVKIIVDYAVLFIIVLAFVTLGWVSAFAIGVKRLHDRNRSGWWIVLFYVVPAVLGGAGKGTDGDLAQGILGLATLVLSIWGLVELGFLRGTRGPNRFGPDPLQRDAIAAAPVGVSKPAA